MFQDKIMTAQERRNTLDLVDGCLCRLCVSDDVKEMANLFASINIYCSKLVQSNILELREKDELK